VDACASAEFFLKSPNKMTLGRSLTKLLREGNNECLTFNKAGWASINAVADAAGELLSRDVKVVEIQRLANRDEPKRFEFDDSGALVRAVETSGKSRTNGDGSASSVRNRPGRFKNGKGASRLPDILYHATTFGKQQHLVKTGSLSASRNRDLYLSRDEGAAWRVAHCMRKRPAVLVVDTQRLLSGGGNIRASKGGLFVAKSIRRGAVLNVHKGYAEQHSAGGILIRNGVSGVEFALVECQRKRRTWEVAKGKIEPGESAVDAAMRELQEEMGFESKLTVVEDLGMVRYAFTIPGGAPRLKAMHLFLFEAEPMPVVFNTALDEGIMGVEWVSPQEAERRVVHSSLRPIMRMLANRYY
jgi:RNA:NAD 2'-phosphotransferase (TPT1/KptA family)/8-oxo-dGTP pyrophosphatase MutT (NUDIX family)